MTLNTMNDFSESNPSMSTEGFAGRRGRMNPDKLPDDHFIDWLAEAKQLYHSELPPFVEENQGSNTAGLRKPVTLRATDDQQPGVPVEAEIICWSWSPQWTFHTIDVGGRRLIVKGNAADRYCSYRSWLGPIRGFSYQPVAFGPYQKGAEDSRLDLRTQHANIPYFEPSAKPDSRAQQTSQYAPQPEWQPSSFSPINSLTPSSARPAISDSEYLGRQHRAQGQQHYIHNETMAQAASPSIKESPRPIKAKYRNIQILPAPAHHDSQPSAQAKNERELSSGPKHDVSSPKGLDDSLDGPGDFVQASPSRGPLNEGPEIKNHSLTSKLDENSATGTQRVHHTPAELNDEKRISIQPHRDNADTPTIHSPQHQVHTPADFNHPARPTKRRREASTSNPTNPTSPQPSTATRCSQSTRSSPRPTPSTSSQTHSRPSTPTTSSTPHSTIPPPSSSSPTPLTPDRQSRTTLFIAIPLSSDTVPLKLRSCMTLSSFFASVLAISAIPGAGQDVVSGIRATFDWKQERDVDRAILLKREFPDTFEVFLEIVDGAPCWGTAGGRCGVGVEVVLL